MPLPRRPPPDVKLSVRFKPGPVQVSAGASLKAPVPKDLAGAGEDPARAWLRIRLPDPDNLQKNLANPRIRSWMKQNGYQVWQVNVPGWNDLVHVIPPSLLPPEEQAARRRRIAQRIQASPSPEVVRKVTSILTAVDNVQDALVTLSLLSRVLVKLAPRTVPYVGWISTLADLANVYEFISVGRLLKVLLDARIAKRGLEQLANLGTRASTRKLKVKDFLGLFSNVQRARLQKTLQTGKVGVALGEIFQALQTTDWLLGTGISLGAIYGFVQDLAFGSGRVVQSVVRNDEARRRLILDQAQGRAVKFVPRPVVSLEEVKRRRFAPGNVGKLQLQLTPQDRAAMKGLKGAALLGAQHQALPFEVHLQALMTASLALDVLTPRLQDTDWTRDTAELWEHAVLPPGPDLGEQGRLAAAGAPLDQVGWPLPDVAPGEALTGRELAARLTPLARAAVPEWLDEADTPEEAEFAQLLAAEVGWKALALFEPEAEVVEDTLIPEAEVVFLAAEYGLEYPVEAAPAQAIDFLERAGAELARRGVRWLPKPELEAIHRAAFTP